MAVDLQALAPKLINLMLDTVFVVDSDNRIVFVSDACETLLGYRANELVGTVITNYMHPDDLEASKASIQRVMSGTPHIDFRNRYIRKDGEIVHILWSARWYEEEQVRVGVARDVTALRQAEEELRFLAHHDPLTELTNRALFHDRLKSAMRSARRQKTGLALLFLDINDFKYINDEHGHSMGDKVLCTIARRLESCVRESDTVARMGGDEFTILLTGIHASGAIENSILEGDVEQDTVAKIVEHISAAIAEPLGPEFGDLRMPSCSIGVAVYPEHGEDADSLLSHADSNMYQIKRNRAGVE